MNWCIVTIILIPNRNNTLAITNPKVLYFPYFEAFVKLFIDIIKYL